MPTIMCNLAGWLREAEVERQNAIEEARRRGLPLPLAAVVLHKRKGKGEKQMGEQYVTMSAADFAALVAGDRDE